MIDPRLPAHYDRHSVALKQHAPWFIASLLEEGDSRDLRWLLAQYGPERLRSWVTERGGRQLSGRSLAFWRLVLDVATVGEPRGEALWPR